jgi:hypothetical protein
VEYLKLKGRVLSLYAEGRTHAEIAAVTGLERSAVTKMIPRVKHDVLTDNLQTVEDLFWQYRDLEELAQKLLRKVESDESGPDPRDVNAFVDVMRAKMRLFPPDLLWPSGTNSARVPVDDRRSASRGDVTFEAGVVTSNRVKGWIPVPVADNAEPDLVASK